MDFIRVSANPINPPKPTSLIKVRLSLPPSLPLTQEEMHNNHYVTSTVSLRCRGSLSFSFNDCPCFLDDRCVDRSPISFPPSSCYACFDNNFSYRVPINPIFLCGWRQSTLIQWSPSRRLILDGVNQCYSRLPVCDVSKKCSYGKSYTFKERSIIGRRGKWGKNGRYGCNVDDAEVILSLLTKEEGEECFGVRQRNGGRDRNVRRVQLEKREKNRGDSSYKSKKKAVESCVLESTSKREYEYVKFQPSEEDSRPNEDRREENMEIFSRGESCRSRSEGSSCSSYYSFSSSGEFKSDSKIQAKRDGLMGDSSNGYERDHRESRYDGEVSEEVDRHRSYAEEQGVVLRNENIVKGLHAASSGIDYDLRKKSEKKLNEELTEQTESWKESSEKHSRLSDVHGSGYAKSSSSHKQYDDRKEKSSPAVNIDEAMRQQHKQAVQRISGQSESRLKYKQFTEMPEIHDSAVETTSSSQKQYRGSEENLLGSSIFVQETARERLKTDGLVTREEKHRRNSQQLAKSLEIREIDNSETSISRRLSDTRMKNQEGDATMVPRLVDDSVEQHYQAGHRVTTQMGSRGEFQQLMGISNTQNINNPNTFISQRKSEVMNFHEDMSEEAPSSHSSLKLDSQSMVHQVGVNKENKTSSNATVRAQLHVEPISGLGTYDFCSEGIESGSSALHVPTLEGSPALQHEIYGAAGSETHGGSINSVSHEDAIGSAVRLQKSSMHFVGEFVEKVRHEVSTSEVQKETRTYNTKLVHEGDPQEQKGRGQYTSGDSEKKDHDSRRSSRGSGTKGPSDEMWDVTDPSIQESLKTEIPEATSTTGNGAVKRTGRSLWSVISDIVRLRWASRSESNNSRSGGKHSPNQSTSSEAWFSGHEPDENNDENMKQGRDIMLQKSSSVDQKQLGEILGQSQGEASSSKRSNDKIKHADLGPPSPSNIESGSAPKGILSPAVEEAGAKHYEGTSSGTVIAESLNPLPTICMRRSHPIVQEISEAGKTDASGSGTVVPIEKPVSSNLTKVSGAGGKIGELKQMKLQRSKQVLKDRFDEWEEAYTFKTEQRKNDEMFMREALLEAKKAADIWEVPVGAVLVQHGKIIARGYNLVEELRDSTAHAEMICIREASNILRSWRLSETTLYVTLEPCPMCAGAILQARIDTIVWGAPNKLLGADGSWIRLFPNGGEGQSSSESTDKPAAPVHPFHPNVKIRRGVLTSECADVMQQFFQLRRRKKDKKPDPPTPPSPSSRLPISSHPSKFLNKMHDAFNIMFCL